MGTADRGADVAQHTPFTAGAPAGRERPGGRSLRSGRPMNPAGLGAWEAGPADSGSVAFVARVDALELRIGHAFGTALAMRTAVPLGARNDESRDALRVAASSRARNRAQA